MVEPVDPLEGGEFDSLDAALGLAMDHLGLNRPLIRFGQGVVVAGADPADGGLDASLGQTFGAADTA